MWHDTCDICGASDTCGCNEKLRAIKENVEAICLDLTQNEVTRQSHISPSFLIALRNHGMNRKVIRILAAEIPEAVVHETWLASEIDDDEFAEICLLRTEANASWLRRWWRNLWEA